MEPCYDASSNSWEPYKALMHVDKLHEYLREHKMRSLIPREHKYSRGQNKRHPLKMDIFFSLGLNHSAYVKN